MPCHLGARSHREHRLNGEHVFQPGRQILTGGAAKVIKEDCEFVDSWVSNLALRGIIIAYKKYIFEQADIAEVNTKDSKNED